MVGLKLLSVSLFCLSLGTLCDSTGLSEENTDLLRRLLQELEQDGNARFLDSSMEGSGETSHEDDPIKEEEKLEDKTSHGGDLLDKLNVNQDSTLAKMIGGMKVGQNGILKTPTGLHPESDRKERVDSLDRHMYPPGYNKASKKNFKTNARLWEKGIVPYTIAANLSSFANTEVIKKAIEELKNKTCVRLVPKDSQEAEGLDHSSYLEFFSGDGCWSYVGRRNGKQLISLEDSGCVSHHTTLHEILHAIGMEHEQSRNDRDGYISILRENIESDGLSQFEKAQTSDTRPYDAESIMQYNLYSFGKYVNDKKLKAMKFKDHRLDFLADIEAGLDFYDVADITDSYQCAADCSYKPACVNGGFVDHNCKCFCPDGLKGDLCQYVDTSDLCGGFVDVTTASRTIQTPNWPSSYSLGTKCTWLIKAPKGETIQIKITELDLPRNEQLRCYHWLEIRYNLIGQLGPKECGQIQNQIWTASSLGNSNLMMLKFDSMFVEDRPASKGFTIVASTTNGYNGGVTSYPTTTPSTPMPTSPTPQSTEEVKCTFEAGETCPFDLKAGKVEWKINSGKTPTYWTGPSHAYEGSWYAYLEASKLRRRDYAAMVYVVPSHEAYEEHCLSFAYHMRGYNMGYLAVYAYTDRYKNLWVDGGHSLGDAWHTAAVTIPASSDTFEIDITAFKGRTFLSDIAIDDIVLTKGKCYV